jgi:hypothetical protein
VHFATQNAYTIDPRLIVARLLWVHFAMQNAPIVRTMMATLNGKYILLCKIVGNYAYAIISFNFDKNGLRINKKCLFC